MGDGGELWAVTLRVIVQLEQGNSQQLHVLGYRQYLCTPIQRSALVLLVWAARERGTYWWEGL